MAMTNVAKTENEVEKEIITEVINKNDQKNVVEELIRVIEYVNSIGEFRTLQRKECNVLVRRMNRTLPLFEEIRDLEKPIPESAIEGLEKLKKAFYSAQKLLMNCHRGSNNYLVEIALETEAIMTQFYSVYKKINQALDGMPYEELDISLEEKEQVELLCTQLRRAKRQHETPGKEFTMDLTVALPNKDDRNGDITSIERMANKLSLHTAEELKKETIAITKLVIEKEYLDAERTQQMIDLLNRLKRLVGVLETAILDVPVMPKSLHKSPSIVIPHVFLCPITLEIMTDPVVIATGQTYERESIQQWLDSNQKTCPKSGQPLLHLSVAPNFALRELIQQWCEENHLQLPAKDSPSKNKDSSVEDEGKILSLVRDLSSNQLDVQRKSVAKIRMLSKDNPKNRILIASHGGIPPLVQLLSYPDSRLQEHAVTALFNLSIDESNKKLISEENPIPSIIEILHKGNIGAKENSAATLYSLSMLDENKAKIGLLNGIPPLVAMLERGTIRGKKDASAALFSLGFDNGNKSRAIEAGIISALIKEMHDDKIDMDDILSILILLASNPEARKEIGQLSFVETLVRIIRDGTPKNKECATDLLLKLGSNNSNLILAALQFGVYEPLDEVAKNGTVRGQRKANAILHLMSKVEQIP